jgi:1,4-alpha-glucan branching enzyme
VPRRCFTLVLHSHLPWVLHHGRWPHGVDWLNEATAETYLPLWRVLRARAGDGRFTGITLGLTPVLCEQLAHPDFHREFVSYLENKLAAAREDRSFLARTGEMAMAALAERWESFYRGALEDFLGPHGPNLVARFRRLEERGVIEIITCGATHGYLPLLSSDAAASEQVRVAVASHRRHFGRAPRGIWLPECGYRPAGPWPSEAINRLGGFDVPPRERSAIETLLAAHGLEYFFVDTHLLSGGRPLGVYADRFEALRHLARPEAPIEAPGQRPYRAYRVGSSGTVSCFGRDPVTALQVWSGEHGYPGNGDYLDFHKKRFPGGHRYWRVTHPTADLAHKEIYRPEAAEIRAPEHARHFLDLVTRTLSDPALGATAPPIACAMFDTELFGHWWFEGPSFLGAVLDLAAQRAEIEPVSPSAYLASAPPPQAIALPEGSWGDGGGHQVWLNDATRWTWERVHGAESRFERLVRNAATRPRDPLLDRLVGQAGRELLLLQSSDWQFLITTLSALDYAELRVTEHSADFERLATLAERRAESGALSEADVAFLADCEQRDALFADYDWRGHAAARSSQPVATG